VFADSHQLRSTINLCAAEFSWIAIALHKTSVDSVN
jgi:hypothetical protein